MPRLPLTKLLTAIVIAASACSPSAGEESIVVNSVVVRLLDEADAPARDAGVVTVIHVHEGQRVRKGDLLAELDNDEQRVAERAALVELAIAKEKATNDVAVRFASKALETAAAELRRSQESIAKFPKSISQSQLDVERLTVDKMTLEKEQAEQDQKLASLELKVRESAVDAAKLDVAQRQIVAPIDGVVVEVATRLGEWLKPGDKAMRIVNTGRLKAEGFVPAGQAVPGLEGHAVWVSTYPNDSAVRFRGRLVFVSPEVDPINNEVRVWAEIDNRNGMLRPGDRPAMVIDPRAPEGDSAKLSERTQP